MSRLGDVARGVGVPVAAGVVMALSLPPFGAWIAALASAAVLWALVGTLGPWRRLLAGWLFGLGLFGVGLFWVTSFNVYGGVVLVLLEALAPALACMCAPRGRGRTPALAGAMVLLEMARSSWPLGGLPLGGAALGQASGPLADAARLGGPRLLVGLVWLGGGGLGAVAVTCRRWLERRRLLRREPKGWRELTGSPAPPGLVRVPPVAVGGPLSAAALAVLAVAGAGVWGGLAADGGPPTARVVVAAVQGGGQRGLSHLEVDPATVLDAEVAATESLVSRHATGVARPALVVWPEDVVALDHPLRGSPEEATLSALARQAGATLLAGVTEPAGTGRFRNEIVAFSPGGRQVASFEKVHRVPFGEYVPWRGLIGHLADLSEVPLDAVPGHGDGVLRTPAGALGAMVSYEVFFADRGRVATRAGARLLVVPTNTSSYSTAQVPTQEIAAARLQALSEGRDLVQAAPTGFSALVDHDGRILERSDLGPRALVVGTLALRDGRTVYERFGDGPVLGLAGLGVVGGWVAGLLAPPAGAGRRRRRQS
ncbi:MAG: apolipoprotein N-acyltransferase [Acidobacteriota bacterium]|nr:apolipoprotein N-acyltransferase [Acidobacteriota bacterium]